jgi:predicted AlkP superfamily phosphohydrolase/phosphomutase
MSKVAKPALGLLCLIALSGEAYAGPVVVIGADGLSFDVLAPLIKAGRTPELGRLFHKGARATLISEHPMRSPALWTTLATGHSRQVHRIYDFVTGSHYWPKQERGGKPKLVTSSMRKVPALWQWASWAGKKSLVVGWLNTWPAEQIKGIMVAPYVALGQKRQTSIKGRIYEDVERQTHPTHLLDTIRPLIVKTDEVPQQWERLLLPALAENDPIFDAIPRLRRYLYTALWSLAAGLTNTAIIEEKLKNDRFDLVMTYFDGTDTLAHRFWLMREPVTLIAKRLEQHGIDPAWAPTLKAYFGRVLDGMYVAVDRWIGRIRKAAGSDATLLIVSDHGWGSLPPGDKAPFAHVPFDGEHRLEGTFLAQGPLIKKGKHPHLTLYDIAPTVLMLLGLEAHPPLPRPPARHLLKRTHSVSVRQPDKTSLALPSKDPNPNKATNIPFEDTELERLKSLGYVQ